MLALQLQQFSLKYTEEHALLAVVGRKQADVAGALHAP